MTTVAGRAVGAVLFTLACASSLAARDSTMARIGGEGAGFDALLSVAAFSVALAALILVLRRRKGSK
jgi:hypothetical protein